MRLQKALITSILILLAPALAVRASAQTRVKTKTNVTVSDSRAVFGEPVTLTATVKVVSGATPVGVVTFKDVTAGELLGSAPVDATGIATLVAVSLKPGMHTIKGTFHGSTSQGASSGTTSLVVRREHVVLGGDKGSLVIAQDARTLDEVFASTPSPGSPAESASPPPTSRTTSSRTSSSAPETEAARW